MCGLAGYNCSQDFADKHVSRAGAQRMLLKEAWLHNLHRGYDAAGFFGVGFDDDIRIFKKAGDAVSIMNQHFLPKSEFKPMRVMAAHTRNPTGYSADVKNNRNNHPVEYGDVLVTHNGTIQNDTSLKRTFKSQNEVLPDVDSIAIAMLLAQVEDPTNLEEIGSVLVELSGSYAFHAMWRSRPGLSLLVAGNTSPLVVAYHPNGAVVYGSEPESVWAMILKGMKLKPDDKRWVWAEMKPGTMFLVENGVPLAWGTFNLVQRSNTKLDFSWVRRITQGLTKKGKKKALQVVYKTDNKYEFAHKAKDFSVKESVDEKELIYSREGGSQKSDAPKLPVSSESQLTGVVSEADAVYKRGDFVYAFFGNVEVVMTPQRTVKDIYNHDLMDMDERWVQEKKYAPKGAEQPPKASTFEQFLFFRGEDVKRPVADPTYEYVLIQEQQKAHHDRKKGAYTSQTAIGMNMSGSSKSIGGKKDGLADTSTYEDLQTVVPEVILTWDNVFVDAVTHPVFDEFIFIYDPKCKSHGLKFTEHSKPQECKAARLSALYTYSAFATMELYGLLFDRYPIDVRSTDKWCGAAQACDWQVSSVIYVMNKTSKWEIPIEETCLDCDSVRSLIKLPDWVTEENISEPMDKEVHFAS